MSEPYRVHPLRLSNGLRTFVVETPYLHTAAIAVYVRTGARHERRRDNGLSHFVEHMLFRGSRDYPSSLALSQAFEAEGGTLYAETGRDHSLYQLTPRPSGVPRCLRILGDLLQAPRFSDIEHERKMILEEILEDLDERGRVVNLPDVARQKLWGGHPLGFPITGPASNVRRFGRADLVRHFRRHYVARNMVLCVGGKVRYRAVAPVVRAAFGGLRAGQRVRPPAARPWRDGPRVTTVRSDAAQAQLHLLFFAPGTEDPSAAALSALLRLLDDGFSTPLHYRICDQKGLAYNVAADVESFHDVSLFEVDAACAPAKLPALAAEVFDILAGFRERLVDPAALARVKERYAEDVEAGYDDVLGLCGLLGGVAIVRGRMPSGAERLRRMRAVTAAQVRSVARRVFDPRGMLIAVGGKFERAQVAAVRRLARVLAP